MKIFVTGGTGFLGSYFLRQLERRLGAEDQVYVLNRKGFSSADPRFVSIEGDLRKIELHREKLLDCDYVFHIGGEARFGNQFEYESDNTIPTQKMVGLLKESSKLKNFVFTSTIGAFDRSGKDSIRRPITVDSSPNPTSLYGKSKLACEKAIRAGGIPATIFRPTWIYGRGMRLNSHINAFVSMVVKKPFMAKFGFPGKVSVIHVEDMARALVNAIGNERAVGKSYFGVTENISLGDILKQISWRLKGTAPSQLPLPTFRPVIGSLHTKIPLALNNLFVDYLCAEDPNFLSDFNIENPRRFAAGIDEVIAGNPLASGVYLITGANSGIGLAVANRLKAQGRSLVLIDKSVDRLQQGFPNDLVIEADLCDVGSFARIARSVDPLPLRCVMNVAGVGFKGSFLDLSTEKITMMVDVNIRATLMLLRTLADKLRADRCDIVNIASSVAYYPLPGMGVYAATKAFLASWSEALAVELKGSNRVFTVSPGGTKTNFQPSAGVKETKDLLDPEEVARRILANLDGRPKTYLYGLKSKVLAMIGRVLPHRQMATLMGRLFQEAR